MPRRHPRSTLFPYTTLFRSRTEGRLTASALSGRLLLPLGVCTLPAFLLLGVGPMLLSVLTSRSEEHTSELQSRRDLVCRLLLEKKKKIHAILSLTIQLEVI